MRQGKEVLALELVRFAVGSRVSYGDLSRSYVERGELTDISIKI